MEGTSEMRHRSWTERLRWRFYRWNKRAIRLKYAYLIRLARRERDMWLQNGNPDWARCCRLRAGAYQISAMMEQLGFTLQDLQIEQESGATARDARSDLTTSGVSDETSTSGSSGDTESK
jgi:hypothetical protein